MDTKLPDQEDVLGVITTSGKPIAFHVPSLIKVLGAGEKVAIEKVEIVLDAGVVKAIDNDVKDLGAQQAFVFAWPQFYPETRLWSEI